MVVIICHEAWPEQLQLHGCAASTAAEAQCSQGRREEGGWEHMGGQEKPSCFLHAAANGHQLGCMGSQLLSFFFKASLTENYKLIC